jgi:hypothetical protein
MAGLWFPAPVTRASGKTIGIYFRWAVCTRARKAITAFAYKARTQIASTLTGTPPRMGRPRMSARGLSFGLTHPHPQPFTGDRGRLPRLVTDAGERW